jgi:hypothetical protein
MNSLIRHSSLTARRVVAAGILLAFLSAPVPLRAQVAGAALTGRVIDPSGKNVPYASVTVKNVATGQSQVVQTDANGFYEVGELAPGDYEVSASTGGLAATVAKVTLSSGARQVTNLTLALGLSLEDLGFAPAQTQGSAVDQATLDKRSSMLKTHQTLGLIATAPLLATLITSTGAGGKSSSSSGRNVHIALGTTTAILYYTSAYYAIFAPKIKDTETRGQIKLHKYLAWVHGVGMILTPILGALADEQKSHGEKVHGIASAHGAVATVTAAAYGASILSVAIKL